MISDKNVRSEICTLINHLSKLQTFIFVQRKLAYVKFSVFFFFFFFCFFFFVFLSIYAKNNPRSSEKEII